MPDFTITLPPEIVSDILEYIDQTDCIECVRVCRRWYNEIPANAATLWRQLTIATDSWKTTSDSLAQCLTHVQRVTIKKMYPYSILKRLQDTPCMITFLEMNRYVYGPTSNSTDFITAVKLFSNTLTELVVTEHPFDASVMEFLQILPKLTHLTLQFEHHLHQYLISDDPVNVSNLVYLHMEDASNARAELDMVLRNAPKLRTLIVSTDYRNAARDVYCVGPIGFDILQNPLLRRIIWCEDKEYLAGRLANLLHQWKLVSTSMDHDDEIGTLRELFISSGEHIRAIHNLLKRSENTLERLEFTPYDPSQAISLETTFPRCRVLRLYNLVHNRWVDFFSEFQQLVFLELLINMDHGQFLDIVQGVSKLQNLHSLQLTTHRLVTMVTHDCICHWLQKCTRLVSIQLFGVCISAEGILNLCKLRSLESLILDMDMHEHCLQTGDLLRLADELLDSGVRTLQLSHMHGVTDSVMMRLARVKRLSALALLANPNISGVGVKAVIHQGVNRSVYVCDCPNVSLHGTWTAHRHQNGELSFHISRRINHDFVSPIIIL